MAHITVNNLETASAELFFENPESFITELGAEEISKIQGGLLDNIVLNNVGGINLPIAILGNNTDNDNVDNKTKPIVIIPERH